MSPLSKKIAYQGEPGANSHIACTEVFPDWEAGIASETANLVEVVISAV